MQDLTGGRLCRPKFEEEADIMKNYYGIGYDDLCGERASVSRESGGMALWIGAIPIACESWHTDVPGFITHPTTGNYYDEWLFRCVGGGYIKGSKARKILREFFENNEDMLECLHDPDDTDGHKALCAAVEALFPAE